MEYCVDVHFCKIVMYSDNICDKILGLGDILKELY